MREQVKSDGHCLHWLALLRALLAHSGAMLACSCLPAQALEGFKSGRFPVLVATDVAARGLDISGVELVVQVQLMTAMHRFQLFGPPGTILGTCMMHAQSHTHWFSCV